jgi:hypothetical protein
MSRGGKRVMPKQRGLENIVIAPSEYGCCAEGTCPQHQQQGESDYLTNTVGYKADQTKPNHRPLWAEAS